MHYINQDSYSIDTADFDFRDKSKYQAGTILQYKTPKPYGEDLSLNQDYDFNWNKIKDLYFLKVKV
jgi:hypothetical protein